MAIGDGGKGAAAKAGTRVSATFAGRCVGRASREELGEVWHASGIRRWTWLSMENGAIFPRYVGWIEFGSANILQTCIYTRRGKWQLVPGKPNQIAVTFGNYEHTLEMVAGKTRPMFHLVRREQKFHRGDLDRDSHIVHGVPYVFPTTWATYIQEYWAPMLPEDLPAEVIDIEEPEETPPPRDRSLAEMMAPRVVPPPTMSLAELLAPPAPRDRSRSREPSCASSRGTGTSPSPAHMHLMGCLPVIRKT